MYVILKSMSKCFGESLLSALKFQVVLEFILSGRAVTYSLSKDKGRSMRNLGVTSHELGRRHNDI